jgi:hypothetical protein
MATAGIYEATRRCMCRHPFRWHSRQPSGFEGFGEVGASPCNEWGCKCTTFVPEAEE